ncbi:MAG: hypothetical protein ABSD51_01820 [Candidatus Binatus sp.]
MSDFGAAIVSLQAAFDLAKTFVGIHDDAVVREKVIELQGTIMSAQATAVAAHSDQTAALKRVTELEKEVADLKTWDAEKEKYELTQPMPRAEVFAYALKKDSGPPSLRHYLCATCYEDRVKSILQKEMRVPLAEVLVCPRCGADHYLVGKRYPEHNAMKKSRRR